MLLFIAIGGIAAVGVIIVLVLVVGILIIVIVMYRLTHSKVRRNVQL